MDTQQLIHLRASKDKFFKDNPNSPLTKEQKAHFTGLSYYVAQPAWDLVVEVTPFAKKDNVQIQHTKGEARWFMCYGEFTFDVRGAQGRLTIYRAANYFFLPFVDANAGTETYGAGRYLEPEQLSDNRFHVDFNQAYNPYCAYNEPQTLHVVGQKLRVWSCPITPLENRLGIPINAGEKLPVGDWVDWR